VAGAVWAGRAVLFRPVFSSNEATRV